MNCVRCVVCAWHTVKWNRIYTLWSYRYIGCNTPARPEMFRMKTPRPLTPWWCVFHDLISHSVGENEAVAVAAAAAAEAAAKYREAVAPSHAENFEGHRCGLQEPMDDVVVLHDAPLSQTTAISGRGTAIPTNKATTMIYHVGTLIWAGDCRLPRGLRGLPCTMKPWQVGLGTC